MTMRGRRHTPEAREAQRRAASAQWANPLRREAVLAARAAVALPLDTEDQRREYDRLRHAGLDREDALRTVLRTDEALRRAVRILGERD